MSEHLVVFSPSGLRGRFDSGTTLLAAARALGVDLDSVCGGRGLCGRCQVSIVDGEQAKLGILSRAGHVTPPGAVEARYAEKRGPLASGRRLGCQAGLCGDVVVDVPEDSQVHRQVLRKSASERPVTVDPVVTLHAIEIAPAALDDPASDGARVLDALAAQWGLRDLSIPLSVLAGLTGTLRRSPELATVVLRRGQEIVAVHPGLQLRVFGVAVDLGSTTIAAHLCDLATGAVLASAGVMNPQIRLGEDLMSRVSYVMANAAGRTDLTHAARSAVDDLVGRIANEAGIARHEIAEVVIVGNPVMHHLFFGFDPTPLGQAPFALVWDGPLDVRATDVGIGIAPGGSVHGLPCVAGHVGADTAAVILAEAPQGADEPTLIVDVGTNAEVVLGVGGRLLACSSPTGPALEGAQLSSGQRAAPGAIERVRIDRETLMPRYRVIGCDLWSDEPGFEAAVATTGVTGLCGSAVIEAIAEMFLAGVLGADGVVDGTLAARSPLIQQEERSFTYVIRNGAPRIAVTQQDVRAVQLAKAALHAGCKLLMGRLGLPEVARVKLAGAFGSHIDPAYALVLGLIPDCAVERVTAIGNAAGHGARIALVNGAARAEIATLARHVEKIETALDPDFQREFVAAMAFPHASDTYAELARTVALPPRSPTRRRRAARAEPTQGMG